MKIISELERNGYSAYLVGGCVRDALLQRRINDWDIATNARPEQIKRIFATERIAETGIKHGTVTVITDMPYEITVFRKDGGYTDHRHPDSVSFTSDINEDLARRDFTVNAMAYSPAHGLVDPFNGKADLKSRTLRTVGNPQARFNEDALRILRGARFAATLGFTVESATSAAMAECAGLLGAVCVERIYTELCKLVCGGYVHSALLAHPAVISAVLPELKECIGFDQRSRHHSYDVYTHIANVVGNCPPVLPLRLAALFHDCAKPDCFTLDELGGHFRHHPEKGAEKARQALLRLRADNAVLQTVPRLIAMHDTLLPVDYPAAKRFLRDNGEYFTKLLVALQFADNTGKRPGSTPDERISEPGRIFDSILQSNACYCLKQLAVNGNDMHALGITGRGVGSALSMALDAVIDGKCPNDKSALLEYIKTAT